MQSQCVISHTFSGYSFVHEHRLQHQHINNYTTTTFWIFITSPWPWCWCREADKGSPHPGGIVCTGQEFPPVWGGQWRSPPVCPPPRVACSPGHSTPGDTWRPPACHTWSRSPPQCSAHTSGSPSPVPRLSGWGPRGDKLYK